MRTLVAVLAGSVLSDCGRFVKLEADGGATPFGAIRDYIARI